MKTVFSVWYRSILSDGTLWCESRNPEEVIRMSEGKDVQFQKIISHLTHDGWESWTP